MESRIPPGQPLTDRDVVEHSADSAANRAGGVAAHQLHQSYVPRYSVRSVRIVALCFAALASFNALMNLIPASPSYDLRRGLVGLVCALFGLTALYLVRRRKTAAAVFVICGGLLAAASLFQFMVGSGVRAPLNAGVSLLIPFAGLILGRQAARKALMAALVWLTLVLLAELVGLIPGMQGTNMPVLLPSYWMFCAMCICLYALTDNYSSVVTRAVDDLIAEQHARDTAEVGKAQAEAVLKYKDEFMAMLSHEIRTPLSGVTSGVQLLTHPKSSDAVKTRAIIAIRQAVNNTVEVLNNLLENSKIDAGKLELRPAPVQLSELLSSISKVYSVHAEARQLDFVVDSAGLETQTFDLDVPRVTQMLSNLLGNSIKFTTAGGVTLAVRLASSADGVLSEGQPLRFLKFSVIDTGPGISPANQKRLFQEFVQIKESGYTQMGTGLGLVVVRKLTHLMGGIVGVESTEGRGSTFWLTVDVGERSTEAASQPPSQERLSA